MVEAGDEKSPGMRMICTGTDAGWNFGTAKVTEKPVSGAVDFGYIIISISCERMLMFYEMFATFIRLVTASGRSRIWPISRSGFSSAIGTSV